ncbi:SRPBCC family protein [Actinokineospora auranticolor]|uniref:Uncharacterized protein YndB with AHSA1/START domain n=1 Tax=Actinokineospora auranticolor TaxID=155976 RepID=A0A2S6H081_9PSEU|nr:SRPBCC family protein [Actinokineospora auranticolor]PPK70883.1 uncharacterized protein YndB with AHSA1/START domain [Actinokineospora auranticolor]
MTETLVVKARIAATVDRVHRAITDPVELRAWLADNAESDADTFSFWGPTVLEGDKPHQTLTRVSATELVFHWDLGGEDSTVEITLAPVGEETSLTLSQSHFPGWAAAAVGEGGALGQVGTWWSLTIANLVEHVEGRELTPRADFTSSDLSAVVDIAASAEDIYDAMVNPARFAEWFGYPVGIEPRVGGKWAMGGLENNPHPATITRLEPGRGMTIDFGTGFGVTSWELEESGGRTRLSFSQSGFDVERTPYGGWLGWLSGLAELRRYVEQGQNWRSTWVDLVMPA